MQHGRMASAEVSGRDAGRQLVCLVTGGNRGIGREVCHQLAGRGHTALLIARSADAAADAAREVGGVPLRLDVTDAASVVDAARWVGERYRKLDALVNNAAITYDTWQRAVDADLAVLRQRLPGLARVRAVAR